MIIRLFLLWFLGMVGVSLVTLQLPLSPLQLQMIEEAGLSESTARLIGVANSGVMLLIAVLLGRFAAAKLNLVSFIARPAGAAFSRAGFATWATIGLGTGVVVTVADQLIMATSAIASWAEANAEAVEGLQSSLTPLMRLTYGGITEEILVRWGLMGIIALLAFWLTRSRSTALVIGTVLAALLFGLGHLPLVFQLAPDVPVEMILRVVGLNAVFGLIFGAAYARQNLETAMLAHASAHVGMMGIALFI